jgi:hypothetical protein
MRMSRTVWRPVAALPFLIALGGAQPLVGADERPLPDVRVFGAEVRKHLLGERALWSQYTYIERREEISVSKLGKVQAGPVKVYEVYPSPEPGNTYKKLLSVDGARQTPEQLEAQDRKHREDVLREMRKRERERPEERAMRLRREEEERQELERALDEIYVAYDIRLVGRDTVAGRTTVVATLEPRRNHRPRTDAGKLMKKIRVRAWVTEDDYQVVRVEGEVIEDVTVGWGLIGRLHKGARGVYERTLVNGEVWLPSRVTLRGTGRALLFRTFALDTETTYSQYRKFRVATDEAFGSLR